MVPRITPKEISAVLQLDGTGRPLERSSEGGELACRTACVAQGPGLSYQKRQGSTRSPTCTTAALASWTLSTMSASIPAYLLVEELRTALCNTERNAHDAGLQISVVAPSGASACRFEAVQNACTADDGETALSEHVTRVQLISRSDIPLAK